MKRYALAAGAAALFILLAACGASSKTAGTAPAPSSDAAMTSGGIVISGFAFSGTLTVKAGQKVTVTNQDSVAHTLTYTKTHLFDTGNIAGSGGTGTFTAPTKPGSYPFGCRCHPSMQGTRVVQS
jgi:plastocyanin